MERSRPWNELPRWYDRLDGSIRPQTRRTPPWTGPKLGAGPRERHRRRDRRIALNPEDHAACDAAEREPGGTRFEIELRFQAGTSYCCAEPGCFLPTYSRAWWTRLREALRDHCDREPPPFTMIVHGVVESGAVLESLASLGMPTHSAVYRHGPVREREAR